MRQSIISLCIFLFRLLFANTLSTMPYSKVRIELFFKTKDELRQRVQFLSSKGFKSYNIVNKNTRDELLEWVDIIREEQAGSSICCHYSAKYNKSRKKDGAFSLFRDFMQDIDERDGDNDVLLISGSGEKGKFNSATGLERLSLDSPADKRNTPIAVAYNPFFPNEQDSEGERDRLLQKLSTNLVKKVYFQFGTDLERLKDSLEWLTKIRSDKDSVCRNFTICGSIFLPTKKLISQQKFRPWNGVFLNEEFLESEDGARGVVLEMIRLYESFGCEILIEAPGVRNEKDIEVVESLLVDFDQEEKVIGTAHKQEDAVKERERKRSRIERLSPSPLVSSDALKKPAILLFGSHDVRLHDNVAFQLASFHTSIIPIFIWCEKDQGQWGVRGAAQVVLKDALKALESRFVSCGLKLIFRSADDFQQELKAICTETGAMTVYWNLEHTTESRIRERDSIEALKAIGVQAIECQSSLLYDPKMLSLSGGFHGGHWGTLMPFKKACTRQLGEPRRPIQRHETFSLLQTLQGPTSWPDSVTLDSLEIAIIKGKDKWDEPILNRFPMSEDDALKDMNHFFRRGFSRYEKERSRADIDSSTSKLSAHLRIGTLSPNEFYYKMEETELDYDQCKTISRRLFWRDLAYYQLLNFPKMRDHSIRAHYEDTEWVTGDEEKKRFEAWKTGQTGYPLVDAGMRELYATGWMTQSVRMVVASFLTEYLRVNWVKGCEWFHYTLVDADSAINAMMWQNAGRSGIDQWNFVMSPVAASQDATGEYTKKWVPELSKLSKPLLHKPWEAPTPVLEQAGIVLGKTYPNRIVSDLAGERRFVVDSVLKMRHRNQQFNNNRGYDLITLPDGTETVVFTKKEFRIDITGNLIKEVGGQRKAKKSKSKTAGRGRRARQNAGK